MIKNKILYVKLIQPNIGTLITKNGNLQIIKLIKLEILGYLHLKMDNFKLTQLIIHLFMLNCMMVYKEVLTTMLSDGMLKF